MKRHELWRLQYRQKRHMEYISQAELEKRLEDVFRNSLILTEEGKIGLRPIPEAGEYWAVMGTHLLEEMSLRGTGMPRGNRLSPEIFPKATWPRVPSAAKMLKGREFEEGCCLFKYGKKKYLKKMHDDGVIRVVPATFYNEASLNSAIKDDERILSVFHHPASVNITHVDRNTGKETKIKSTGNVKTTFELSTNYYVYCMSYVFDLRLFDDFQADACVVIHDAKDFLNRIDTSSKKLIRFCKFITDQVRYVDPLNPPEEKDIDLFFCKHFRYSYQKEMRSVWVPEKVVEHLGAVYLEIGPMNTYSEYIEL